MIENKQIDLRTLSPRERHQTVFRTFDALPMERSFEILTDHDPKGLFSQFKRERAANFNWEYTEKGPAQWKVRITKTTEGKVQQDADSSEEGCCGICSNR